MSHLLLKNMRIQLKSNSIRRNTINVATGGSCCDFKGLWWNKLSYSREGNGKVAKTILWLNVVGAAFVDVC